MLCVRNGHSRPNINLLHTRLSLPTVQLKLSPMYEILF